MKKSINIFIDPYEEVTVQELMRSVEKDHLCDEKRDFRVGETITVSVKIQEGDKTRIQAFQGVVIQRRGSGMGATFTVRKASGNVYVERVFPLHSPLVTGIKRHRKGKVRRAKLYYLRDRTGKSARLKERK